MIELSAIIFDYPITVTATPAGLDWNVTVLGGCAPHIGSVSLGEYQNGTVTLRTLTRETHKDQIVGDRFARALAGHTKSTVCVSCGIHYDNAAPQQLEQIIACTEDLLMQLFAKIR